MAGGGPIPIPPIDLGGPVTHITRRPGRPSTSYLALSGDVSYNTVPADLRVSLPSGVLSLNDGTMGGAPLSGISFGLPTGGLIRWDGALSGVQGDSLAAFMREFPRYTRVNWDKTSLGAQLFTAVSRLSDELIEAGTMSSRARFPMSHPLYEQGLAYEYNFNEVHTLDTNPAVSGQLGTILFGIPLVKDEHTFWTSPPTRLETTSAEVNGLTLLEWTQVGTSGLAVLLNEEVFLPIHNQIVVEVSGAKQFTFDIEDVSIRGQIYIKGRWPHDGSRYRTRRMESIPVYANAPITTRAMYSSISQIEARGLDPSSYVRIKVLDFNAKWKSDSLSNDWGPTRGQVEDVVFWQLTTKNTAFSGIVQPENHSIPGPTSQAYLARTRVLTDTIFDQDLEWDVLETWKISDQNGTALSGIVDIAPVPNARYILLLDSISNAWVIDTYRPAIDMAGFAETAMAPARIQISSPKDASETPGRYTVALDAKIVGTADGIQRWRWAVHHHDGIEIIPISGAPYPFHHLSGWQSGNDELISIPKCSYIVSGAGQYIFELAMVTDTGKGFETYAGFQQVEKRALGALPIRGLTLNPSGIEFDSYSRPWVAVGGNAVRLVMRNDVGIWLVDQRTLLTRESYDEVTM